MEVRVTMFMVQGYYYPGIIEVTFPRAVQMQLSYDWDVATTST